MSSQRPGQLTAIAIIAIVLGLMGGCAGLWGLGGALLQGQLQSTQEKWLESSGMPASQLESQRAMQHRIEEIQRKWMPFTATQQTLNLLASAALLAAGVLLLRMHARGPMLFVASVIGNLVVDLAGGVLGVVIQQDTQEVMHQMMADMAAQSPGAPGAGRMFEGIVQASSWLGVCMAGGWFLLKAAYYVWGIVYLRKPEAKRLFAGETSPAAWREAP